MKGGMRKKNLNLLYPGKSDVPAIVVYLYCLKISYPIVLENYTFLLLSTYRGRFANFHCHTTILTITINIGSGTPSHYFP